MKYFKPETIEEAVDLLRSSQGMPSRRQSERTSARVMPPSRPALSGGVVRTPPPTMNTLLVVPSATSPSPLSMRPSYAPARRASMSASTLLR